MNYIEYLKNSGTLDHIIIVLKEKKFTDPQIIDLLDISKQTIYNAIERQKPLLDALRGLDNDLTAEVPVVYGDEGVNLIINSFKENFGTTKATKADRFAANRLSKKHGAANMVRVITTLAQLTNEAFAPTINSVSQLDAKLPQVIVFLKKHDTNDSKVESL